MPSQTNTGASFHSAIAHDIRNPLHSILLNTECLLDDLYDELTPDQRNVIADIRRATMLVSGLSNTLLTERSIAAGTASRCDTDFDVVGLVRDCVLACQDKADSISVRIEISVPEGAAMVRFDRDKLQVAILNILNTAIRFADGEAVTVKLEGRVITISGARLDVDKLGERAFALELAQQCLAITNGTVLFSGDMVTLSF